MPASEPRSRLLGRATKKASHAAKAVGLRKLRGRVKTSRWVHPEQRPAMHPHTRERLRATFHEDVQRLDTLLGTRFRERWGYP